MEDNSKTGLKVCATGMRVNPVGQLMKVSVMESARM